MTELHDEPWALDDYVSLPDCQAIEPLPVDDATYTERRRLRRWPWRSGSDAVTQTGVSKRVALLVTGFRMDRMKPLTNRSDGHRLTVSIVEAAHLLAIGRTLAYEAARRGDLRTIRVGRRVLVPVLAIEELLAQASEVTESSVRRTRSEP